MEKSYRGCRRWLADLPDPRQQLTVLMDHLWDSTAAPTVLTTRMWRKETLTICSMRLLNFNFTFQPTQHLQILSSCILIIRWCLEAFAEFCPFTSWRDCTRRESTWWIFQLAGSLIRRLHSAILHQLLARVWELLNYDQIKLKLFF